MASERFVDVKVYKKPRSEMKWKGEPARYACQEAEGNRGDEACDDGFGEWFSHCGGKDHMFSDANPSYAAPEVARQGHVAHRVVRDIAGEVVSDVEFMPKGTRDHVVFSEETTERRQALCLRATRRRVGHWFESPVDAFEVGFAIEI